MERCLLGHRKSTKRSRHESTGGSFWAMFFRKKKKDRMIRNRGSTTKVRREKNVGVSDRVCGFTVPEGKGLAEFVGAGKKSGRKKKIGEEKGQRGTRKTVGAKWPQTRETKDTCRYKEGGELRYCASVPDSKTRNQEGWDSFWNFHQRA